MSTTIRPDLSESNEFYISKDRYYELKHFCLQYSELKDEIRSGSRMTAGVHGKDYSDYQVKDPTFEIVSKIESAKKRVGIIEKTISILDPIIQPYIFKAVTEGLTYTYFRTKCQIPYGRDLYYREYRRFFWLLDNTRE